MADSVLRCAVAQMRGVNRGESKTSVVTRMTGLLERAHAQGAQFVAFPELALTTFFPRYWVEDLSDLDSYYETSMPGPETAALFAAARRLQLGFSFGFAELTPDRRRFNSAALVAPDGTLVGVYRKVHLPGHDDHRPELPFQHLEKRYFQISDTGFQTWETQGAVMGLCICNDRRWPETYRVLALKGAEIVALGYNTPTPNTDYDEPGHLNMFHHLLSLQAGAYQNGVWVLAAAKCGTEDGFGLMGGSCIVAPTGEIVARASSSGDELLIYDCDLSLNRVIREHIFNFSQHRRIEHYKLISELTGR